MIKKVKLNDVCAVVDDLHYPHIELQHQLEVSVREYGLLRPPVVNWTTKNVIDGRLLVNVLRKLGWEDCWMWCMDLAPEKEQTLRLALNNHACDWNWKAVSLILKDSDPKASGFHPMDYKPLVAADWKTPIAEDGNQFTLGI